MRCISPQDAGGVKVVVRGFTVTVRYEIDGAAVVELAGAPDELIAVEVETAITTTIPITVEEEKS